MGRNWVGDHLLQSGGCWYAAGTKTVPAFISYLFPRSLEPPAPHYPCVSPPQTEELQNCPWALLVPALLKRLVTQASSGPRVWKLLIEGCLQPEWQTQGHCSIVVALVYVEGCVSVQSSQVEAVSHGNYTPSSRHSTSCLSAPTIASKKLTACVFSL